MHTLSDCESIITLLPSSCSFSTGNRAKFLCGKAAQKDHQGKMCGNENNDPAGTENSSVHSGPPVTLHIDQRPNLIYYVFGFTSLFTATCQ